MELEGLAADCRDLKPPAIRPFFSLNHKLMKFLSTNNNSQVPQILQGAEGYLERGDTGHIWINCGKYRDIWNLDTIKTLSPKIAEMAARMMPGDKILISLNLDLR